MSPIPRKFSMSPGGIKRKALLAVPTICRYCGHPFLDKVYEVGRHKVICPHCHKTNATTNFPTMEKIKKMAKTYDTGTAGGLGGYPTGTDIRDVKDFTKEQYKLKLIDYLNLIEKNENDGRRNKSNKGNNKKTG